MTCGGGSPDVGRGGGYMKDVCVNDLWWGFSGCRN